MKNPAFGGADKNGLAANSYPNHTRTQPINQSYPVPEAIRQHLHFLFDNTDEKFRDGKIEISILHTSRYFTLDQIEAAVNCAWEWNLTGENVYVCPALLVPDIEQRNAARSQETGKSCRTTGEDFYASNVCWADIDKE